MAGAVGRWQCAVEYLGESLRTFVSIVYSDLSPWAQQYCSMKALLQTLEDSPANTRPSSTQESERLIAAIEGLSTVLVEVTDGRGSLYFWSESPPGSAIVPKKPEWLFL